MWLLCFVIAHLIIRAWEQGRAQAGAEWRRGREHVAGRLGIAKDVELGRRRHVAAAVDGSAEAPPTITPTTAAAGAPAATPAPTPPPSFDPTPCTPS